MVISCLRSSAKFAVLLCLLGAVLAGCKPSAEAVADVVSKGISLEQAGDAEAAVAAYRQALDIDSESIEARRRLAALYLKTENLDRAQKQYAALLERLPGDIDANQGLAEIALAGIDLQTAVGFAAVPIKSDPASPRTEGIRTAIAFYQADAAGNAAERDVALAKARQIIEATPEVFVARRIVIQSLLKGPDPAQALPFIQTGLMTRPKSLELNMMRLNALSRSGDSAGGIAQLKAMYRDFPDNSDVQAWLTEWYLNDAPPDEAIAFLRDLATRRGNDPAQHDVIADYVEGHFAGRSAADELYRIANSYPQPAIADRYRARAAAVRFAEGETEEAISEMQALMQGNTALSKSSPFRMALANMLIKVGKTNEALPLIDAVLAADPKRLDAPALKAQWQIQGGDIQGALATLNGAIAWAGKDPLLLTLIAEAYEKDGNIELARSSLLDAASISHNGVRETQLLVRFLQRTDTKTLIIDDILRKALEAHPGDPELVALARQSRTGITAGR